jgi:hypothetical protein
VTADEETVGAVDMGETGMALGDDARPLRKCGAKVGRAPSKWRGRLMLGDETANQALYLASLNVCY